MKIKILSQIENPLLSRLELKVEIESTSTPTKKEVISAIKKEENLTVIRKITSNFGKKLFIADILVYDNKEAKEKYTFISKKVRIKMEAEKKAAEETAAKEKAEKEAESQKEVSAEEKVVEETSSKKEEKPSEEIKEEKKE